VLLLYITLDIFIEVKNKEADELSNRAYQEILESDPNLLQKTSQHMATEEQLKLLKSQGITPEKYLGKN
jgi:hypothetical protein